MKLVLLIVFLLLGFLPTLLAQSKRRVAAAADTSSDDGEQEDSFFDFEEPEPAEEPASQSPYFTYEAPEAEVEHAKAPVQTAAYAEEPARPAFDLRQAVVYQTLLTNNYINPGN